MQCHATRMEKDRIETASQLFFANIPYNCSDREFKDWIGSHGIEAESIRIIRDLVSGVSPAFAYATVTGHIRIEEAVVLLNGKKIRNHAITVKQAPLRRLESNQPDNLETSTLFFLLQRLRPGQSATTTGRESR